MDFFLVFKQKFVTLYNIHDMNRFSFISALLLIGSLVAPAAEVWAPGVSVNGGWYD